MTAERPRVRVLLLRSGGEALPLGLGPDDDVDVLVTHDVVPSPEGIARTLAFEPRGARLVISGKTTVAVLAAAGGGLFRSPFVEQLAAGEETAAAMRAAGSTRVRVPEVPGAAGILDLLAESGVYERFLWPRGSDADTVPIETLNAYGAAVSAPVVYVKRPREDLDEALLEAFLRGEYTGVAVASLASLDVFLPALAAKGISLPAPVRWGVIGPATAKAFEERGLPRPLVPAKARLLDLIDLLRES